MKNRYAWVLFCLALARVIDVSDPASPFEAGFADTADAALGLVVRDDGTLFVADRDGGLRILSIWCP